MMGTSCPFAVALLTVVTARCAKGGSPHVHLKTKIQRLGSLGVFRSKVAFADVDRAVSSFSQQSRQRQVFAIQAYPVPFRRTEVCPLMIEIRVGEQTLIA